MNFQRVYCEEKTHRSSGKQAKALVFRDNSVNADDRHTRSEYACAYHRSNNKNIQPVAYFFFAGSAALDFFVPRNYGGVVSEIEICREYVHVLTFFARFLRSCRSFLEARSTLGISPPYRPGSVNHGITNRSIRRTLTSRYLGSNFLCASSES
jgi:hypothetical protein